MYYEINVSLQGNHLFATHARSITDATKAKSMMKLLRRKFPESQGYKVECTRWEKSGLDVTDMF